MGSMATLLSQVEVGDADDSQVWSFDPLDTFASIAGNAFCLVGLDGRARYASPALGRLLGRDPEALIGWTLIDDVHPEDRCGVVELWSHAVCNGDGEHQVDLRLSQTSGEWRWFEIVISNRPELRHDSLVAVHLHDITARVPAGVGDAPEHVRFRAVVDNSYDAVAVIDESARVQWVTPNIERILGWTAAEVAGTNGLDLVHPDDHDAIATELLDFISGEIDGSPTTLRLRHKDGSWHWVELASADLRGRPDVEGIALNLRQVDERVSAEQARQRLLDIFELTNDIVSIQSSEDEPLYMNTAARRFFGLETDADVAAFKLADHTTAEHMDQVAEEIRPMLERRGHWSGEIALLRADGVLVPGLSQVLAYRSADGELVISTITRDISERKAFEVRLQHDATHDPLTGLPNRNMLLDRLEMRLARSRRFHDTVAVLFCDLDHFKMVNDRLGHHRGDRLLLLVAERLRQQLRPDDTVSRFGGDEYVILCEDVSGADDAVAIATRIAHAFRLPFDLDGNSVYVGISIGIAICHDGDSDPETLTRNADVAMYRAKARGRNRLQVFEPFIWRQAVDRFDLENALRRALDADELELFYQPIVDLHRSEIVGAEALLRWHHPDRGLVLPRQFIGLAEETGLMVPIGNWVLEQACRQMHEWHREQPDRDRLWIAVNISARQLQDAELLDTLGRALDHEGIDPTRLHLEITESVVMDDVEQSQEILAQLKRLGVALVVDDFGTGYSSLSYLRRFPVDALKVDRSFVDGLGVEPEDSTIVAAVVSLAQTLGLEAIAEGVEHEAQCAALLELDCHLAQGYLLGEAVPAREFEQRLAAADRPPAGLDAAR
jgi:diguanylate cyclase (GGDEF)-like protein/PAS domain S-box-containing protein